MRDKTNKFTQLKYTRGYLNYAHEYYRREKIFHAVLCNQANHDHRQRTCSTGDHAGSSTKYGCKKTDNYRSMNSDQRMHTRDKCKGDRLRH